MMRRSKQSPIILRHAPLCTTPFPAIPLPPLVSLETSGSVAPSPPEPVAVAPCPHEPVVVAPKTVIVVPPEPVPVAPCPPPPLPVILPEPVIEFCTVTCPHCLGGVIIHPSEKNCAIFRHGTFRNSGEPIPPHATKAEIDVWLETNAIYGCGGPFRLTSDTTAEKCDYI